MCIYLFIHIFFWNAIEARMVAYVSRISSLPVNNNVMVFDDAGHSRARCIKRWMETYVTLKKIVAE